MNTNTINKYYAIKLAMTQAKTMEELKRLYHIAMKALHPDNNDGENDIENIMMLSECYVACCAKITGKAHKEFTNKVNNAKKGKAKISRTFKNMNEFFSCDGIEQLAVIKNFVCAVSRALRNATPTPNNKQITDKHHADKYGNFDGMRTYCFASYILNSNYSVNNERLDEVSHRAWIKLMENSTKEKYNGYKVSTLLWISARQALYNEWYNIAKTAKWLDRTDDLYNMNAYETKAPIEWETEQTAIIKADRDMMDTENVLYLKECGYSNREIADIIGTYPKRIDRLMEEYKIRNDVNNLMDAMTNDIPGTGRKNETAITIRKRLIMQAIRTGMSYKRIAYHIGLSDRRDKNGNIITITEQITAMLHA